MVKHTVSEKTGDEASVRSQDSPDALAIAAIKDVVNGKQLSLQGIAELRQRVDEIIDNSLRGRYASKAA